MLVNISIFFAISIDNPQAVMYITFMTKQKVKDPIAVELGRRGGIASSKRKTKEQMQAQARLMNQRKMEKKRQENKYESA